jgi:hypothetical protein
MFKKSQAAMEFLMTYGWAILVVLVAIGALAYFGVLSPDRFLPSKCQLPAGIACLDHRVVDGTGADAGVHIVLRNGLGFDIESVEVSATGCTTDDTTPATIANGGEGTYVVTGCDASLTSGSKYSGDVNVTYTNSESSLSHNLQGSIASRAE